MKFQSDQNILWTNLSRLSGTMILANISLFFLTRLVTEKGYYYTFYSLLLLGLVEIAGVVPHGLFNRLWFYLVVLCLEGGGAYFLVVSAVHWVTTSRIPSVH